LLKLFAVVFVDWQLESADEMVQNRLIVLLQDVLYHVALSKVLVGIRCLLASQQFVSKFGVRGLRSTSFIENLDWLFVGFDNSTQWRMVVGFNRLCVVFEPIVIGSFEVLVLNSAVVFMAQH
jgi:hypothetical protein